MIQDYFPQISNILRSRLPPERLESYPQDLTVADISLYEELKPDQMGQRVWDQPITDQDLWSGDVLVVQLKPQKNKSGRGPGATQGRRTFVGVSKGAS